MSSGWVAPESDVVLLTRVFLMRNFADTAFDSVMTDEEAAQNVNRVTEMLEESGKLNVFSVWRLADMTASERGRLVEHNLIEKGFVKHTEHGCVFLSKRSTVSIMVNGEDHVCVMGFLPGLQIEQAADLSFRTDGWLDSVGAYAFDEQFGYLTSAPAWAGAGMRVEILMHLPTMRASGQIGRINQDISSQGLTLRPLREEKGDAWGNLFLLAGTVRIGKTEENLLNTLCEAAEKVIACERGVREKIFEQEQLIMEDRIARSKAMICAAKLMNEHEMMQRCSDLRLAAALGIDAFSCDAIDGMRENMGNASIECQTSEKMTERQRDALRADMLREEYERLLESEAE